MCYALAVDIDEVKLINFLEENGFAQKTSELYRKVYTKKFISNKFEYRIEYLFRGIDYFSRIDVFFRDCVKKSIIFIFDDAYITNLSTTQVVLGILKYVDSVEKYIKKYDAESFIFRIEFTNDSSVCFRCSQFFPTIYVYFFEGSISIN